ncbi:MAG: hypothetical protein LBQ22_09215 [Bacteroidales bacterium]|jgi:hypothetical protein|nr:hypothetical protein [Bacteroidales bacterium]
MKKKLTKLNLEAIEKELPCLSEDDARAVVGGNYDDYNDCLFQSVKYVLDRFGCNCSITEIANKYVTVIAERNSFSRDQAEFYVYKNGVHINDVFDLCKEFLSGTSLNSYFSLYGGLTTEIYINGELAWANGNLKGYSCYDPQRDIYYSVPADSVFSVYVANGCYQ